MLDLSKYSQEHPGGLEVLLFAAGEDCTEDFDLGDHSSKAEDLAESLAIGTLAESS